MSFYVPTSGVKPGSVGYFAGDAPPPGWLVADGSAVAKAAYPALFAAIGEKYGNGAVGGYPELVPAPFDFSAASWEKALATVTPDAALSPLGDLDADLVAVTGPYTNNLVRYMAAEQVNQSTLGMVGSIYIRAKQAASNVRLFIRASSNNAFAQIRFGLDDLSSLYENAGYGMGADWWSITDEGNGWRRIALRAVGLPASGQPMVDVGFDAGSYDLWGGSLRLGNVLENIGPSLVFNLPDLREEFIRGASAGRAVGSVEAANVGEFSAASRYARVSINDIACTFIGSGGESAGGSVTVNAGGGETRPRNMAQLPCIKY